MNTETRTYYLTKYALTKGIQEVSGRPARSAINYVDIDEYWGIYELGDDVFKTLPEALANAEARRQKKLASLRKQIMRLEKLSFEENHEH